MKLFNTLGRQLQVFEPQQAGKVKLYTCGPTVYDYAHIGNLRSFVFDDLLRRALQINGYSVKHVMNITDVGHLTGEEADGDEDKLEKGAEREGKTVWQVAEHYTSAFIADAKQLNILPPNGYHGKDEPYAHATDFIDAQVDIVKLLLDKGNAYQTKEAIYFDVTQLADYGKLTGQTLSDKEVGARDAVVVDQAKKNPQDFALWFFKVGRFANHSMAWDSPWGEGFPGWHLECSAIIHETLGEPIDIHTGGVDHVGTHHTNEIAQTEAAFGLSLAKYWLHNEHLLVSGERMAKSAGNFYTLADVKQRDYDPMALRLLYLQAHYRSQMNFSWEALEAAATNLKELRAWADHQKQSRPTEDKIDETLKNAIVNALSEDLNSAKALAAINESLGNTPSLATLEFIDQALGFDFATQPDITQAQKDLVSRRESARAAKDWAQADELRTTLQEQGLGVNDSEHGPVWYRL